MNDYLVMALLFGVPGLGALAVGIMAWSGRWRSWAPRYVSIRASSSRNYEPLQVGLAGVMILLAMVPLTATLERWESAGLLWTVFAVFAVPVLVTARLWWPHRLTPRWHKDWIRRGGDRGNYQVPLWGPAEKTPDPAGGRNPRRTR